MCKAQDLMSSKTNKQANTKTKQNKINKYPLKIKLGVLALYVPNIY